MAYERVNWENLPSKNTPINQTNLNKMDVGIANAVKKTGDTMTGALTLKKTSFNYNGGAILGARQAAAHTIEDLINELRYTNGQIGSVEIKTAYTLNNITISVGWYNYSYIPHRSGGTDGGVNSVNDDNTNFGTLMLTGMSISSPVYVIRYTANGIKELTSLATTNVTKNLQTQINNMFNLIYPVGSVYISVNSTNPASLFGGTWKQIKGRFLLGTGSLESNNNNRFGQVTAGQVNVPAGEKGGETYHKLTINEMPKHKHNTNARINWYNGTAYGPLFNQTDSSNVGVDRETIYTDEVGGDNSHNNIPPYFAVFIWQRTA